MSYEPVIGLEIHVELKTKTKMFCYSLNDPNEKHPNLNVCPVCMGHPGTLPVINQEAVKKVITVGLALNGEIPEFSQFDRKNYFYPDLPKGYQISQYQHPLVVGGYLDVGVSLEIGAGKIKNTDQKVKWKRIRIRRIHLEEDTGRLLHDKETGASLVDFNRAGVPLMELVTEPDLRSGGEVKQFGEELQRILRYLGASDADMEKGEMRVEVNISLREIADQRGLDADIRGNGQRKSALADESPRESALGLGTKVEIKNINSFKFAADAVDYEIKRQTEILEKGEKVAQETRGWNEFKKETFSQRSKEEAHDYRYFPEPDLPPLRISRGWVEELRAALPELPPAKRGRFSREYGLAPEAAEILVREKALADYFESMVSELRQHEKEVPPPPSRSEGASLAPMGGEKPKRDLVKTAAAFLTGDFLRLLNDYAASVTDVRVSPENFAELVVCVAEDRISNLAAKVVLSRIFHSGEDPSDVIDQLGLWQMSDVSDLENIAAHIIRENSKAAEDYKKGKEQSLQFLVGQVMKESRGKANPRIVQDIIKKILL